MEKRRSLRRIRAILHGDAKAITRYPRPPNMPRTTIIVRGIIILILLVLFSGG